MVQPFKKQLFGQQVAVKKKLKNHLLKQAVGQTTVAMVVFGSSASAYWDWYVPSFAATSSHHHRHHHQPSFSILTILIHACKPTKPSCTLDSKMRSESRFSKAKPSKKACSTHIKLFVSSEVILNVQNHHDQ